MKSSVIIVESNQEGYPQNAPFRPDRCYPENPFPNAVYDTRNQIYSMVREGFKLSEYDMENFGTKDWNPLEKLIIPGNTVLIKPNLVMDYNPSGGGTDCLYTHPSIVAAVCDYVIIALKGNGRIIIGDAPMQECDFEKLIRDSGYYALYCFYKENLPNGISIDLVDLRKVRSTQGLAGVYQYYESDVRTVTVDLGNESAFFDVESNKLKRMRITNYDPSILKKHHNEDIHEYCINAMVLESDVLINMPKPKTHRKAGATAALKNIVGINARKEYLPHHTNGSKQEGGDEFLYNSVIKNVKNYALDKRNYFNQGVGNRILSFPFQLLNLMMDLALCIADRDHYYEGSWYGNDTISRTIMDLNKILYYADKNGQFCENKQRKTLIVADMIICGEGEGPVAPMPKVVGWIAMSESPITFDETIMTLMGAKTDMIPTLRRAKEQHGKYIIPASDKDPYIISNGNMNLKRLSELTDKDILFFEPTIGWREAYRMH